MTDMRATERLGPFFWLIAGVIAIRLLDPQGNVHDWRAWVIGLPFGLMMLR